GSDGDLDRSPDVPPIQLSHHDLVEAYCGELRDLDRTPHALHDGLHRIGSDERHGRRRADPDPAHFDILAVRAPLLHRARHDRQREGLGAALDVEPRGLAGPLVDSLGQLVPGQHRLALEGHEDISPPEAGLLRRKARDDLSDRGRHVWPGPDVPALALLAEHVASLRAGRGDRHVAAPARPLDRELERSALRVLHRGLNVLPVLRRAAFHRDDAIPGLQPRLGDRPSLGNSPDDGGRDRAPQDHEDQSEDYRRQDEVHGRPGEHDEESDRQRLLIERPLGVEHARAPALERILVVAHHLHVAAEREQRDAVLRLLSPDATEDGAKADRKRSTPTPDRRATMKCPNSWTRMRTPSTTTNETIVVTETSYS